MSRLENWYIIDMWYGKTLCGDVYDDDRFPDGKAIVTTSVQEISEDEKIAKTKNTTYELGYKLYK